METHYFSFVGGTKVAEGTLTEIIPALRAVSAQDASIIPLTFEASTGRQVDFDLNQPIPAPLPETTRAAVGRPKLGVVAREVTLLPRHWEWLEQQPSGASAALRRLVDEARKSSAEASRMAADAACRFMLAMAGNLPGYEEATRAVYAPNPAAFQDAILGWPIDIRTTVQRMSEPVFAANASSD